MNIYRRDILTSYGFARFTLHCTRFNRVTYGQRNGWTLIDKSGFNVTAKHGLTAKQVRSELAKLN